jgi:tRNA threonylcarbamoyladenosine biosynthesis protein TsaE
MEESHFSMASAADLPAAAAWLLTQTKGTAVVLLSGEMGAGKTTLVRAVAAALGVADHVSSPTYGLVHTYRTTAGTALYHFDLYRLQSAREALDLGIFDYLDEPGALSLVEWPERLAELLPEIAATACHLTLAADAAEPHHRRLALRRPASAG